jgi:hypothetical protein
MLKHTKIASTSSRKTFVVQFVERSLHTRSQSFNTLNSFILVVMVCRLLQNVIQDAQLKDAFLLLILAKISKVETVTLSFSSSLEQSTSGNNPTSPGIADG